MPKRTFWLTAGVALGAGSTLWAERRVRRTIEQTAARLAPDALVAEVGRTARHVAESAGDRVRDAYSEGRDEMHRREEQLWSNLADRGATPSAQGDPVVGTTSNPAGSPTAVETATAARRVTATGSTEDTKGRSRRATRNKAARATQRMAARRAKSPSHLGN